MIRVIAHRLFIAVPILFIVASLTFLLIQFIPGDPAITLLGPDASAADYARVRTQLGLDQPIFTQYTAWLADAVRGDFGESLQARQPVAGLIADRLPITVSLAVLSIAVTTVVGVGLGTAAALVRGRWARTIQIVTVIGASIPSFWLAIVLVGVVSVGWGLLPAAGYVAPERSVSGWATSLVLPVAAIAIAGIAAVARQTRGAVIDVLGRDYVRTILATGASPGTVLFKHVLRNAAIPVTTTLGFQFVLVLSGAIVIERVFALPGIGQLMISAIGSRDVAVAQGIVVVTAGLVVLVNLAVDLLNALLNPKMRIS
ncbi:ABC transporter permease [Rhodococcus sp. 14-2483-1-2]|uniref:ABC transporter permease n=1 Tax=Rhodococcus sp. 14-2483-1-2 TaxID=2023147 RepID=UPI000B9AB74E|nr:ABC transporter permease [Rhodococcus sp. 14-2483-1-2]OZF26074.1 hypothetical protein CH295_25940 [Rhodococcus sp. 14-2483-1-2]